MANSYFQFKHFTIHQDRAAMKVTTDGCLFGAWVAHTEKELLTDHPSDLHLLDIGTGTGLLSLLIAQQCPHRITALDIDAAATTQAKENAAASPWSDRITVLQQDIRSWQPPRLFDCIVCNPPFYENEWPSDHAARNMAHHSSHLTLEELTHTIGPLLSDNGRLYLLLPFKRWPAAQILLKENGWHLHQLLFARQTPRHQPFRVLIQAGKNAGQLIEEEIIIKNEEGQYSERFNELLRSYYLKI
ncbi:MAG: methyltransferase [Chitinophagaceae bacterium]